MRTDHVRRCMMSYVRVGLLMDLGLVLDGLVEVGYVRLTSGYVVVQMAGILSKHLGRRQVQEVPVA